MKDPDENVIRFMELFKSNDRSYGIWTPKPNSMTNGTIRTVRADGIPREAVRTHLEGHLGLGCVPILDDHTCWWGAIDFDTHGPKGKQFNILELGQKIRKLQYPLVLARTKSGGAHGYLFLKKPVLASVLRPQLQRWAATLGWHDIEIFPKQVNLDPPLGEKERQLGNWLNMPYFRVKSTNRYALQDDRQLTLEEFLTLAESMRYDITTNDAAETDYAKGPPCVQAMMRNRIEEGNRNLGVFQAAIFLKRAFPDSGEWKAKLNEFNGLALAAPLEQKEVRQIAGSVNRKDYNYKCREEPCKSLCDRELCRTREFGITDGDTKANELPPFDKIEKVIATPVRWVLFIKGSQIELTSQQLFNFAEVRMAVYEKLNMLLPRMKADEWDVHLREVAERAKTRYETTVDDIIFTKMCDFLRRASQDKMVPEETRREALLRRRPALISLISPKFNARGQVDDKGEYDEGLGRKWYYAFRAQDFIDYMVRHKTLIVQQHQVHTVLHRVLDNDVNDYMRDKMRVGSETIRNVWCVPEDMVSSENVPVKKFEPEF